MKKEVEARKEVTCYRCGSEKVTAYIDFSNGEVPRPKVNFHCAECKEHGLPTPIMGIGIEREALKFIFEAEDIIKEA